MAGMSRQWSPPARKLSPPDNTRTRWFASSSDDDEAEGDEDPPSLRSPDGLDAGITGASVPALELQLPRLPVGVDAAGMNHLQLQQVVELPMVAPGPARGAALELEELLAGLEGLALEELMVAGLELEELLGERREQEQPTTAPVEPLELLRPLPPAGPTRSRPEAPRRRSLSPCSPAGRRSRSPVC